MPPTVILQVAYMPPRPLVSSRLLNGDNSRSYVKASKMTGSHAGLLNPALLTCWRKLMSHGNQCDFLMPNNLNAPLKWPIDSNGCICAHFVKCGILDATLLRSSSRALDK